eukprot:SAG11_NODE_317_length_10836_cov_7.445469_1_plen_251_part_00
MMPGVPPEFRLHRIAGHVALSACATSATDQRGAAPCQWQCAAAIPAVSELPISPDARRLTAGEQADFARQGFVHGLPVFTPSATAGLVAKYDEVRARLAALPRPLDVGEVFWFFKSSRWFYELTMLCQIHDYVEGLLGADFFLWGGAFFAKRPGDGSVVPFHQDAHYWGLHHTEPAATTPHTVVVWRRRPSRAARTGCALIPRRTAAIAVQELNASPLPRSGSPSPMSTPTTRRCACCRAATGMRCRTRR